VCIIYTTGGGKMRVKIYLGKDFLTQLKEQANRYEMSVSQYIRYAIKKLWESEGK
jgi:Arc/MetJ-type ribon-helix-helix transcriptional regulator